MMVPRPVIAVIGQRVYRLLVVVHICPLGGQSGSAVKLPIATDADAERRKCVA
jgi:hypothetical protein